MWTCMFNFKIDYQIVCQTVVLQTLLGHTKMLNNELHHTKGKE